MIYLNPKELTENNYYDALGDIQNHDRHVNIDIVTFTGLMGWEEKVIHYTHYFNKVNKE